MPNQKQIKQQLEKFHANHSVSSPMGHGITDGVTTCSCGAEWRTWYSRMGLEWKPLNREAKAHDKEQSALPDGYGLDQEGNLFRE